jgi:hypothetical protein
MSSFVVKSKIFLRFEPVEDRQSLSNVFNRMFGRIFLDFSICEINPRQAGLSRATLEISSEFSSYFHLRTHKSHSAHHWDHLYKWGFLPLELIFILRICKIWFGPLSLSFEYDPISGCWDFPPLIFWGRLPSEVVFHRRSSSIRDHLPLEVVFHQRLSFIWGWLNFKD